MPGPSGPAPERVCGWELPGPRAPIVRVSPRLAEQATLARAPRDPRAAAPRGALGGGGVAGSQPGWGGAASCRGWGGTWGQSAPELPAREVGERKGWGRWRTLATAAR